MEFTFQYRITYESGQCYDRNHQMVVQITKEEYKKIIQNVLQGIPINQIEDIPDVINEMTECVQDIDRWYNINGTQRSTPLKKSRAISDLEFFLPESEYARIKKMKDPMEVFDRPEEHMTIYRNDGSSVVISSENGKVSIYDSRNKNSHLVLEADYFLSKFIY